MTSTQRQPPLPDEKAVAAYRRRRFHQLPSLQARSYNQLRSFVEACGLCLFQAGGKVELPSLWGAASGSERPAPRWGEHDQTYNRMWGWKDDLFSSGEFYYGKALGEYRLFISRRLLPYLWAAHELNYGGEEDDYLELYQDGKLSQDAMLLYRQLRQQGPSSTTQLRRGAGMVGGPQAWARFERALSELQRALLISAVGVAHDNAWKYTFRYATLNQAFPQQLRQADSISAAAGMDFVVQWYTDLVGLTTTAKVARLFRWPLEAVRRSAARVAAGGGVVAAGEGAEALVSHQLPAKAGNK